MSGTKLTTSGRVCLYHVLCYSLSMIYVLTNLLYITIHIIYYIRQTVVGANTQVISFGSGPLSIPRTTPFPSTSTH